MPLLVNSVPNLAQGVSQQPDNLRYPGQCDEQINAWATVVEGLVKRPPTTYTKKIGATDPGTDLFTHFVKRDEDNKYCVTVSLGNSVSIGQVGVIDLESGNNVSVAVTSIATSYLSGISNPLADLRALTVADYTFLVNKNKTVQINEDLKSNDLNYEAIITVKLGDYEKRYDIYLDGNLITSTHSALPHIPNTSFVAGHTYESAGSSDGVHADTEYIADHLEQILDDYLSSQDGLGTIEFSDTNLGFEDTGLTGYYATYYQFELKQYSTSVLADQDDTTLIASGIQGELSFKDGAVHSWKLTHAGSGYDTTQPSTTYKLIIKKYYGHILSLPKYGSVFDFSPTLIDASNAASFGYTMPGVTFTTTQVQYEVERNGSVIKITGDTDFSLRTEDGLSNEALIVAYKEVGSITDLPKHCYNNFRVKVIGDADIDQDDYYVVFKTKDKENFGEGSWIETVGWTGGVGSASLSTGIEIKTEDQTLPITLVPKIDSNGDLLRFFLQTPNELINQVEHDGVVYSLIKEHVSNNSNKPGSSVDSDGDGIEDWKEYWVVNTTYSSVPRDWEVRRRYDLKDAGYTARQAGDDNSNPFPSFVGGTINDVFFFKNRLGFLTDSNVIFSEADEYFNFFRTTTQQLLDSAPIDVGLSHTKVAVLQHAVPFQEKLMLFSKQSQFVLRGADILSPKTVAISPVTEYDISDSVQPIALGNYIYFTFRRNDFEGMYEYFVDNNTETFNSEEITSQIPKYITKQVEKIAGSQAENTIVVGTSGDRNTLFVYKYFWSNKEKIQSAWMKFTFGREVRGFDFIDSNLHLFTKDDDGLHLEKLTLEDGIKDEGLDYTLYLDSKVDGSELTTSYDAPSKTTTISGFEYNVSLANDIALYTKLGNERAVSIAGSNSLSISGYLASYVTYDGTIYKCDTTHTSTASDTPDTSAKWSTTSEVSSAPAWSAGKFYNNDKYFFVGIPYNMLYRFSDQTLKQPTERGGRSASDYAFQTIRNGSLNYAETGHFTVEVTPKFRDKYTYAFNPDIVGANLTLNAFTPQDGHFRFPVQCQPNEAKIEVVTDSALPVKLLAAEFESMMIPRSRRYGA